MSNEAIDELAHNSCDAAMLRGAGNRTAHHHYAWMSERPVSLAKIFNDTVQSQTRVRAESIVVQLPPALARRINSLAHELTCSTSA
jgi:hypothetical protein